MAGIGEACALAAAGIVINKRTSKPNIKNQNNKSKKEKSNTRDMYSSNNSRNVQNTFETKGKNRYRKSRNFRKTKIIPKDYQRMDDFNVRTRNKVARIEGFVNGYDSSDSDFSDDNKTFDNDCCDNQSVNSTESDDGYHGFNAMNPTSVIDKMTSITNNRKFES
jgi:hypothetical protein